MAQLHTSNIYLPDGRHDYTVEELRPFFQCPATGDFEPKDADVISPIPPQRKGPRLMYEYVPDRGFSLAWKRFGSSGEKLPPMISVGNPETIRNFMTKRNQAQVPYGSFVSGEKAYQVIQDFAADPSILSGGGGGGLDGSEFPSLAGTMILASAA